MSEAYESRQWDVFTENNELRLENDQLKAENAKLRELVRDMYGNYRAGWNEEIEDELYERMRELGVVE